MKSLWKKFFRVLRWNKEVRLVRNHKMNTMRRKSVGTTTHCPHFWMNFDARIYITAVLNFTICTSSLDSPKDFKKS